MSTMSRICGLTISQWVFCFDVFPNSGGKQNLNPSNTFPPNAVTSLAFPFPFIFPFAASSASFFCLSVCLLNSSKCFVKVWKSFLDRRSWNFSTPSGTGVAGSSLRPRPSPKPSTERGTPGVSTGEATWPGVSATSVGVDLVLLGPASGPGGRGSCGVDMKVGVGTCGKVDVAMALGVEWLIPEGRNEGVGNRSSGGGGPELRRAVVTGDEGSSQCKVVSDDGATSKASAGSRCFSSFCLLGLASAVIFHCISSLIRWS